MKNYLIANKKRLLCAVLVLVLLVGGWIVIDQNTFVASKKIELADEFRMALSVSPFTANAFEDGYTYEIAGKQIASIEELEQAYIDMGATEMYARIATKRYKTAEDTVDGVYNENANVHTLEQGIALAKLAAKLNIPLNPEIMCAYTYMDMETQQAPRFEEYPEFYELQGGKNWSELTLHEINTVLEAYGTFVATEILNTGCEVNCWNIGNEANFGFAGVSLGLDTAVNPKLAKVPAFLRYVLPIFATRWLEKNLWSYNAKEMAALQSGILKAYENLGKDSSNVQFSTHIATVVSNPKNAVSYFNTLLKNGYEVDVAGISYYPSAPAAYLNRENLYKKVVTAINQKCNIPVFIAEFSYPSGKMDGPFAGWNKACGNYEISEEGQKKIFEDTVSWGKEHGLAGIRYWAPDYEGWSSMSMFNFENKHGVAKAILSDLAQSK